ncbi:TonB-dependent receptor [Hymenobacter sp. 5516J-16]|nr:TonB-dependent receptor [Hymenobacter sp. 5516J-16]
MEYATVALLPATGTTPLTGGTCDAEGRFELKDLPTGAFRLQISFVGYSSQLKDVALTAEPLNLGTLTLTASAQNLAGVTVTGERPVIETKPDRLVYNADQDATNAGGTAADILRKTPMVNLDGEGNVQLRGTSNVRILINNKPSSLLSGNLAEALKQIPADQIKAIEVVTSPSAKYDAEGSGGVINIVLKKSSLQGVNGSVGANTGNRNQGLNGSLNVKRGKFGVNTKLSSFHNVYPIKAATCAPIFYPMKPLVSLRSALPPATWATAATDSWSLPTTRRLCTASRSAAMATSTAATRPRSCSASMPASLGAIRYTPATSTATGKAATTT